MLPALEQNKDSPLVEFTQVMVMSHSATRQFCVSIQSSFCFCSQRYSKDDMQQRSNQQQPTCCLSCTRSSSTPLAEPTLSSKSKSIICKAEHILQLFTSYADAGAPLTSWHHVHGIVPFAQAHCGIQFIHLFHKSSPRVRYAQS